VVRGWLLAVVALLAHPMLVGDVVADWVHPLPSDILVDMSAAQVKRHVGTHTHKDIQIAETVFRSKWCSCFCTSAVGEGRGLIVSE